MTINEQEQRLRDLLQPAPAAVVSPTSRYATVGTAVFDPDGERPIVYLLRRLVPRPERLPQRDTYVVAAGDRTDRIAAAVFGDPELFWRLCDGNRAVFPEQLVQESGRRLRITEPEGTPGAGS
ncbi:LysM domain-containing protein [Geodermatophilus sp. SYSU D01105]